jgi:hypothetical protein
MSHLIFGFGWSKIAWPVRRNICRRRIAVDNHADHVNNISCDVKGQPPADSRSGEGFMRWFANLSFGQTTIRRVPLVILMGSFSSYPNCPPIEFVFDR